MAVYVGRLSYAIYLWHWLMLTLWAAYRGLPIPELTAIEVSTILGATLVLSWLSFHAVENPIRQRRAISSRNSIFAATTLSMAMIGSLSFALYWNDGYESRIPESVRIIAAGANDKSALCSDHVLTMERLHAYDLCQIGAAMEHPGDDLILLWGVSHASALLPALH